MKRSEIDMLSTSSNNTLRDSVLVGSKYYELSNHLGNVLTVFRDVVNGDATNGYWADVSSIADYSPFGVQLDGRTQSSSDYRYGFQGQEIDNEIKGEGNSVNYKYRMHDPRVGRFFAVDPLTAKYPWYTPYSFSGNHVINAVELEGLEEMIVIITPTLTDPKLMHITVLKTKADCDLKVTYIHRNVNGDVISSEEKMNFISNSAEALEMSKEYRGTGKTKLEAMEESLVEITGNKIKAKNKNQETKTPLFAQHLFQMDLAILFKTDRSDISKSGIQTGKYDQATADIEALNRFISTNISYLPVNGGSAKEFDLRAFEMVISGETDSRPSNYSSSSGTGNPALGMDRAISLQQQVKDCLGGMKCSLKDVNHEGAVKSEDRNTTVIFSPKQ